MTIFVSPSTPTTPLTDLLSGVLPQVPGCPNVLAVDALNYAAIDFCQRTMCLRYRGTLTTAAATNGYTPTIPPLHSLYRTLEVKNADGSAVEPSSRDELNERLPQGWESETGELFLRFWNESRKVLHLYPLPSVIVTLSTVLAIHPAKEATEIDAELADLYHDDLQCGARAYLKRMRRVPWTDPAGAKEDQDMFYRAIAGLSVETAQGFTRAPLRTKSHYSIG